MKRHPLERIVRPQVLDACCGGKMMWFDQTDPRAVFIDIRRETHVTDSRPGRKELVVDPDHVASFTDMPFDDGQFSLVVFDPPHIIRNEARGWITKKYGVLNGDWKDMLRDGFKECFRVLRDGGVLIFKWSDSNVPVSEILALTDEKPLFGHKSGKKMGTHWIAFMRSNTGNKPTSEASSA